jgi:chemotaxis protein methyltransferase CheR
MTQPLTRDLHKGFTSFLRRNYGLRFTGVRAPALDYGVRRVCNSLELSADALLRGVLLDDPALRQSLLETVTVGETYFFREPKHFNWLAHYLKETDRQIHLWSAGCATGEEAYTMAIVALQALGSSCP